MADDKYFQSLSDYELNFLVQIGNSPAQDVKQALKEIHRRQENKEIKNYNHQRDIKVLTIIILIFTVLTLIVGTIQLIE